MFLKPKDYPPSGRGLSTETAEPVLPTVSEGCRVTHQQVLSKEELIMSEFSRRGMLVSLAAGGGVLSALAGARQVSADQPHMKAALDELRAARKELEMALHDKGGHREKALQLTNDAITQVERGIEYDRTH
jgi:hypothetical protein